MYLATKCKLSKENNDIKWLPSIQPLKFIYRKYMYYYKICVSNEYNLVKLTILNNPLQVLPRSKVFLLAILYHLLTIYFSVGDYCLSNSLTSNLVSSQSSSLYWLRNANTDKTNTPNRLHHKRAPTNRFTLAIQHYRHGNLLQRHTHQLSPVSLPSPS